MVINFQFSGMKFRDFENSWGWILDLPNIGNRGVKEHYFLIEVINI